MYSPVKEKHNILYLPLRRSINQRHKQKLRFDVNPLLDKGLQKEANLAKYRPEHSAGVEHIPSLVLVESFVNDLPLHIEQPEIDEFWEFLLSGSWSTDGQSVRVLEGQLYQLLLSTLVTLTQERTLVQHSTVAYAKNIRKKLPVYNALTKEHEVQSYTETLLLEFIYYGHFVQPAWLDDVSSADYPDHYTTHSSSGTRLSEEVESSENGTTLPKLSGPIKASLSSPPATKQTQLRRRRLRQVRTPIQPNDHITTKFITTTDDENSEKLLPLIQNTTKKGVTFQDEESHEPCYVNDDESSWMWPRTIPRGFNYRQTCSDFSNASDEYRIAPPLLNLSKFACTEKVSYLGEFELPEDSDDSSSEDDETFEEDCGLDLYLDEEDRTNSTTGERLTWQKRKEKLHVRREQLKLYLSNSFKPEKKSIMPEFSKIDVKKYVTEAEMFPSAQTDPKADKVPELEEYAEMLMEEKKRRMRLRMLSSFSRHISSGFMSRLMSGIKRTGGRKSGSRVSFKTGDSLWKVSDPAQRKILMEQYFKTKLNAKKKTVAVKRAQLVVPLVYITTATGITYLHPLSFLFLKKKRQEEKMQMEKNVEELPKRRVSLLSSVPTALTREINKARQATEFQTSSKKNRQLLAVLTKSSKSESVFDEDANEKTEGENYKESDSGTFDIKKLDKKYSIKRLKEIKKTKQEDWIEPVPTNTAPHWYHLLKKYIRMQTIFRALKKPKKTMEPKKKDEQNRATEPFSTDDKGEQKEFTIGKLRYFAFLDQLKSTRCPGPSNESFFKNYSAELFRENLERALTEYVVRREIAISDYSGKVSASITFTKRSVFTKTKYY